MLKLAVIGDPVAHSASPALHREFLSAASLAGTYEAIRVGAGDGGRAIDKLRAAGYTGLNVTTPLKEEAFARADEREPIALAAGAVNTLVLGPRVLGYNTDGLGTLAALRGAGLTDFVASRVLVLGGGPAARAAVTALSAAGAIVWVWNRTQPKADAIVRDLRARPWTAGQVPDAVFATLAPDVRFTDTALVASLLAAPIVVDANYGPRATLGAALGRCVVDGAAMLAASARASFEIFRLAYEPMT